MKKFLSVSALSLLILAASSSTFAANNVSNMATQKGGQHVAECGRYSHKDGGNRKWANQAE